MYNANSVPIPIHVYMYDVLEPSINSTTITVQNSPEAFSVTNHNNF